MSDEKKLKQLEMLMNVSALINSTLDHSEIQERTIKALMTLLDAEAGSLMLIDEETGELYFEVATGEKGQMLKQIRLSKGQGIAGWVAMNGEPLIVNDVQADSRFFGKADKQSGFITKSIICVPVKSKDKIIGIIEGINKVSGAFTQYDVELMENLSNQVAIAIENAKLYNELKEAFYDTAEALAETIELRDPYTGGHTRRVRSYSMIIGAYMELDKKQLENLKLAAILHDIGKIGVRDETLLKQDRLTDEEFLKMKMHAQYGADILKHIKQLRHVIPGVKGHHERTDGRGYPEGLNDGSIPLTARIIAVADTFDAMTTNRPYRKGLTTEHALDEIKKCAGTQFDAEAVDAFLKAWQEGALKLED